MNYKTIKNLCEIGDPCVLQIDGKYFGYDNNKTYPEILSANIKNAYIFKKQKDALAISAWHSGKTFILLPA